MGRITGSADHAVDSLNRLLKDIDGLAARELSYEELADLTLELVGRALPHGMTLWFSLDPATLLPTRFSKRFRSKGLEAIERGMAGMAGLAGLVSSKLAESASRKFELAALQRIMKTEFEYDDSLSFGALARRKGHVATLRQVRSETPQGEEGGVVRELPWLMQGMLSDELRLMLTDAGEGWGMVWMGRREGEFDEEEVAKMAALGPALGRLTRLTFLQAAVRAEVGAEGGAGLANPPGLVLVGEDGALEQPSAQVREMLGLGSGEGDDGKSDIHWVPVMRALAEKAGQGRAASMVVDSPAGPVTVHASRLGDRDALIVERARPCVLADRLVRAYGLSPRERDVVGGVSKGWSTRRIAFELDLADYTVQDHLGSIFNKVGVRSRKEVLAKLFFEHYVPEHQAGSVPSPYGWFLPKGE